jgi:hypothetical protein
VHESVAIKAKDVVVVRRARGAVSFVLAHLLASLVVCLLMSRTTYVHEGVTSVPVAWTWVMTGTNLASLYGSSRARRWGWRLGIALQPVSIQYCVLTGQAGFVPGNLVTLVIYLTALRGARSMD